MRNFSTSFSATGLMIFLLGSTISSANAQVQPGAPSLTITSSTKGTLNNQQLPAGDSVDFELDLGNNLDNMGDHWVQDTWILNLNDSDGNGVANLRYRFGNVVDAQGNTIAYKLYGTFVVPPSGSYSIVYSGNTTKGGVAGGDIDITSVP